MKARMKWVGAGALGGAVLFAAMWLLCRAGTFPFTPLDGCFFMGLALLVIALLFLLSAGRTARFSAGTANPTLSSVNLDIAMEKTPANAQQAILVPKLPLFFLGAGILDLLVCGVLFLF